MTADYDPNFHHLRVEKRYTDNFELRENYLKEYDYVVQDGSFQIGIAIENISSDDFSGGVVSDVVLKSQLGEPMILNSVKHGQQPEPLPAIKSGQTISYVFPFSLDFSGFCSIEYNFQDLKTGKPIKIYTDLNLFNGEKIMDSRDSVFYMTVNLLGSIRKMELIRQRELESENKFRSCWIAFVATLSLVISIVSFVIK